MKLPKLDYDIDQIIDKDSGNSIASCFSPSIAKAIADRLALAEKVGDWLSGCDNINSLGNVIDLCEMRDEWKELTK